MARYPSLNARVVIVTGGGRGLGRVMALALLEQGARVVITAARSQSDLDETLGLAETVAPGACRAMLADVTDAAACEAVAATAVAAFGRVDGLVNNAALPGFTASPAPGQPMRFWEADVEGYRRLAQTNFVGPFLMARAAPMGRPRRGWKRPRWSGPRTWRGRASRPMCCCLADLPTRR